MWFVFWFAVGAIYVICVYVKALVDANKDDSND